jgi:hypothetical protein
VEELKRSRSYYLEQKSEIQTQTKKEWQVGDEIVST